LAELPSTVAISNATVSYQQRRRRNVFYSGNCFIWGFGLVTALNLSSDSWERVLNS